jgi:hypothetical protein
MVSTIDRVRQICSGLAECVVEEEGGGGGQHHSLLVAGKRMGWHLVDHHRDGRVALTVKAAKGENEALVAEDPERFFMPPYVARHGYVGYYLDTASVDWDEARELIVDAYRLAAPKRLTKQLDADR